MRQLRTQNETSIAANFPSDSTWNPDDFWLDISATNTMLSSRAILVRKHFGEHTHSEHDWGWVLHELAHGNAAAELIANEACSRGGVHGFCTGIEGVILHSISKWCRHGASHRKNFDTPPLRGCCRALGGGPERPVQNE
jgi:hypothetical protein